MGYVERRKFVEELLIYVSKKLEAVMKMYERRIPNTLWKNYKPAKTN